MPGNQTFDWNVQEMPWQVSLNFKPGCHIREENDCVTDLMLNQCDKCGHYTLFLMFKIFYMLISRKCKETDFVDNDMKN